MIDLTRLQSITEGDKATEKMLLTMFYDTTCRILSDLQNHNGEWKKLVHELRGAAANLGLSLLAEACKEAEENPPKGPDREAFFEVISQTILELESLIA